MEKGVLVITVVLLAFATVSAVRNYGTCDGYCGFNCSDGSCIPKENYCDGRYQCPDKSDEEFCKPVRRNDRYGYTIYECSTRRRLIKCSGNEKCIPAEWKCDGVGDCPGQEDETGCGNVGTDSQVQLVVNTARQKAIEWMKNTPAPDSATRKWGTNVHKIAVALYLSDQRFLSNSSLARKEITYELSIQLLSRLSQKRIQNIPASELASFISSFLVTCIDPRDFYGFNLVEELRTRVEKQNYTNPYVLLTLCNAGDSLTQSDVTKLTNIFSNTKRDLWTDTRAIAVMALSCARNQSENLVDSEFLSDLTLELKNHQYRNGTVENLQSTLLVMQALYAAETDEDPDNFDEKKALTYILQNQKSDGSFGNVLLSYYALPVLSCKSLVNISMSHCAKTPKDEETAVFDLMNRVGPKVAVHYSIWIGAERDIEKTIKLRVAANTSFYGVIELAAGIDSRYKFEYVIKNRKPYISAVSGIMDDAESGQFWFPYTVKDKVSTALEKSPADFIPQDDDHIVLWYRRGNWTE